MWYLACQNDKQQLEKATGEFFCKMYVYTSNCCKTNLLLVKQPLAHGFGELPEAETAGVDVDQV